MEILYSVILMPANICCFSHNRNNVPKKKGKFPQINILTSY